MRKLSAICYDFDSKVSMRIRLPLCALYEAVIFQLNLNRSIVRALAYRRGL